jgi:hypothetical protein
MDQGDDLLCGKPGEILIADQLAQIGERGDIHSRANGT